MTMLNISMTWNLLYFNSLSNFKLDNVELDFLVNKEILTRKLVK